MSKTLQAIRGMNDILPSHTPLWQHFEQTIQRWLTSYGYQQIRTPIVESTPLFIRAIGEVTDIVEKEMYSFTDTLNGESLTLRPEGTAACVRAALQHGLLHNTTQRLWYLGPMFRHERPQKGRYRQFHQVGVEALGFAGPDIDAELLLMSARLWQLFGLDTQVSLQINTLGDSSARARYRERLIAYLERYQDVLDEDGKRRLYTNPLRVLDSKNPALTEIIQHAPQLMDDLDSPSRAHFEQLQQYLHDAQLNYVINPRLVRGLDYYNATVFEWVTDQLGAQGTVCAGGRYDGLIHQIGGKPTPACGFGMGIERLLLLLEQNGFQPPLPTPNAYLVHHGNNTSRYALQVAEAARDTGLQIICHAGGGKFASQMKKADASGATWAIIIGDDEATNRTLTLKPLRSGAPQITLPLTAALTQLVENHGA